MLSQQLNKLEALKRTRLPLNAWAYITNRSTIVREGFCFSLSNVSGRLLMIGHNYFEILNLNLVGCIRYERVHHSKFLSCSPVRLRISDKSWIFSRFWSNRGDVSNIGVTSGRAPALLDRWLNCHVLRSHDALSASQPHTVLYTAGSRTILSDDVIQQLSTSV